MRVGSALSRPVEVGSGVPQGSCLGPLLFLLAFDAVFRCQLPEGVQMVGYADDLVLSGSVLSAAGEERLQEGLRRVEASVASLGMALSVSKCQGMVVSLSSAAGPLLSPLKFSDGSEPEMVDSFRYLGTLLDNRLSLDRHWQREAGNVRAVAGSFSRLVGNQRSLLQLAVRSVAEGRVRHSLPATLPASQGAWRALRSAFVYAARLIQDEWGRSPGTLEFVVGSEAVLEAAGLREPRALAAELGMGMVYQSVMGDWRWGLQLEREAKGNKTRQCSADPLIRIPDCRQAGLRHLAPFRLLSLWNFSVRPPSPPNRPHLPPPIPLSSLQSFLHALPEYLVAFSQ